MAEHIALYRKWRPAVFDDVCGQETITRILKYQVESDKTVHAYLFCGSRGTGKTTCARILAKAINCLSPVDGNPCGVCENCRMIEQGGATDIIEMDAASNNGVEYIRDIRDAIVYTPAQLKYRVYIIDEVHMLSDSAFNALLKTLEEPPPRVVFILATTEMQKLPATVVSRCQRYDFQRLPNRDIVARLSHIVENEGITADGEALSVIATLANGGMRDAISLLELCASDGGTVTIATVNAKAGTAPAGQLLDTVEAVARRDYALIFAVIADVFNSSRDIAVFWQELTSMYRNLLVSLTVKNPGKYIELPEAERERLYSLAPSFQADRLLWQLGLLEDTYTAIQRAGSSKRLLAELALIKMSDERLDTTAESILPRLTALENAVRSGLNNNSANRTVAPAPVPDTGNKPVSDTKKPASPAAKSDEPDKADPGVLHGIRDWAEVLEGVRIRDKQVASILSLGTAYRTDGGDAIIIVPDEFTKAMLERGDAPMIINDALSALDDFSKTGLTSLTVKVKKQAASGVDLLDG